MAKAKKRRAKSKKTAVVTTRIVIPDKRSSDYRRAVTISAFGLLAFGLAIGLISSINNLATRSTSPDDNIQGQHSPLGAKLQTVQKDVATLEQTQNQAEYDAINPAVLQQQLASIRTEIDTRQRKQALSDISKLENQIKDYDVQLIAYLQPKPPAVPTAAADPTMMVPILVYHYPPSDFDNQLDVLEQKNYTVITLDQLNAGLHGQEQLPAKPVVITFDDGFANQMSAFAILQKHHMPATYYIIDGGERSKWCIGAGRKFGDPLQPDNGCGDAYLSWDQVRELDHSGLITIGSHTVDHEDLATEPASEQEFQIVEGKRELEAELGHPVRHFAYPYGTYTATTISLVQQAGFVTAVTTNPGLQQSLAGEYALNRVRDTYSLP